MSTRCQIGFYEAEEKNLANFKVLIYRHSDGYPDGESGVVADVMPFLRWWKTERGISDFEYCSARLLQYLCNKYDNYSHVLFKNEANGTFESEKIGAFTGTLGHGISKGFHGDIDYLYAVRPDRLEIYQVTGDTWNMESDQEINGQVTFQGAEFYEKNHEQTK